MTSRKTTRLGLIFCFQNLYDDSKTKEIDERQEMQYQESGR